MHLEADDYHEFSLNRFSNPHPQSKKTPKSIIYEVVPLGIPPSYVVNTHKSKTITSCFFYFLLI